MRDYRDAYGHADNNPSAVYMGVALGLSEDDPLAGLIIAHHGDRCFHRTGASAMASYLTWTHPGCAEAASALLVLLAPIDHPLADNARAAIIAGLQGKL